MFLSKMRSSRQVQKVKPVVKKIEEYKSKLRKVSDVVLQSKTDEFKRRLEYGGTLDQILPEAFAVVSEASRRVLGMEPYPVQLIGGILLYKGKIAEMATGEGKTLVAALPSYLIALEGKGVHVVTVNGYLAQCGKDEIGAIHSFLGLTVGCVTPEQEASVKREMYQRDITYVTNNELGFDYLRDNMVMDLKDRVQRGLHYAIIDEVDSILIDEARTPLIISGKAGTPVSLYQRCQACVAKLEKGESSGELTKAEIVAGSRVVETGDYIVDEKAKSVHLTAQGVQKVESFFQIENFSSLDNLDIQHHIQMALRANSLMTRDVDYVVKDDEILIVDEFTGRILPGRRYSEGLHQAIEAKEHVTIQKESRTMATITFQNFFNLYDHKAGMTGTAMTEAEEFRTVYHMDVVTVPTNRPVIRKDLPDKVFRTKDEKNKAVTQRVKAEWHKGRPVLVGTTSIEASEHLSRLFAQEGIPHEVLNAKQLDREAEIVALAGNSGAVTIATNMAGRGTDIKLDEQARRLGGLLVIGTERHEARRIDNQLRGRAGRQGDPGESQFYLSLEDDLLRLFGESKVFSSFSDLSEKAVARLVTSAQRQIEANHFGARKNTLAFDTVNHKQRQWVYGVRNTVLESTDLSSVIKDATFKVVDQLIQTHCTGNVKDWDMISFVSGFHDICPMVEKIVPAGVKDTAEFTRQVHNLLNNIMNIKKQQYGRDGMLILERATLLRSLDVHWMNQIRDLEVLQESISFVGYGQKDPVVEYKKQAFRLFQEFQEDINQTIARLIMRARIVQKGDNNGEKGQDAGAAGQNSQRPEGAA